MHRALDKANALLVTNLAAAQAPRGSGEGDGVRALVEAVRREETTVILDVGSRVNVRVLFACYVWQARAFLCYLCQAITLRGLSPICYPSADAANELATLKAKAVKAGVKKPFPYMELAEFVASWAALDVRCF